jgi:hypothetical protein
MGSSPREECLRPTPRMVSKRDSQRPIGNTTGPGRERDGGRGSHKAPCVPRRAAGPTTATAGHAAGLVPQCPGSGPGNASRSDAYPAGRWPL